jgi:hypothetical protein
LGWLRFAPFGVPVVPLVRMTTRPFSAGGTRSEVSPRAIKSSINGSSDAEPSGPSNHATKRLRRLPASCTSSANSWS